MSALRRVVVTGAGGFIGRAVCAALSASGCEIRAIIAAPGHALDAPPGIAYARWAEITDRAALAQLMAGGADAVIHLAGPPSVRASFEDPVLYALAHTGGTAALLEAWRRRGCGGRFVYVSSAEVYGRPRTDPVDETHPLEARSPYGAAKIGAEQLVRAFDHAYGTTSAIMRPFSVYGRGMGPHALVPAIVRQLDAAGALRLADLRPVRDYCHVDDVARAIVAAARAELPATVALNVGSGVGVSVRELAQETLRLAGIERAIEEDTASRRPGNAEILRLVADPRLAGEVIGWAPQVPLATGLLAMLPAAAA